MREPMRHKVRSALIVALVALPVLAMAFLSLVYSTQKLTPAERAAQAMGAADGILAVTPVSRVAPPDPAYLIGIGDRGVGNIDAGAGPDNAPQRDARKVDLAALLPAGTRLTLVSYGLWGVVVGPRRGDIDVASAPFVTASGPAPIVHGVMVLQHGRWPRARGDVAVSPSMAKRFGLRIGSRFVIDNRAEKPGSVVTARVTVSGIAAQASCLSCDKVFALPSLVGTTDPIAGYSADSGLGPYLVSLPPAADAHALWQDLARHGVAFLPRDAILHGSRYRDTGVASHSYTAIVAGAMIIGFGLLEVVLLAGTAFAVGARRQVRELGLVGATGGTPRDVRRIVLMQGFVLGAAGGLIGLAAGFVATVAGWSKWEGLAGHLFGSVVASTWQLAAIVGFGVLAGVLAALVPAVSAARLPIVAALSNRFVPRRKPMRRPMFGVGMIAIGTVIAFVCAAAAHGDVLRNPYAGSRTVLLTGGAVVGIGIVSIGILLAMPALVAALGALADRLPLTARLAARDADRHRHRTAPAIGAVCLAVAGTIAIGFVVTGAQRESARRYQPYQPIGSATMPATTDTGAAIPHAALAAAAREVGASRAVPRRQAFGGTEADQYYVSVADPGSVGAAPHSPSDINLSDPVVVADPADVPVFTGHPLTPAERAMLASGGGLAFEEAPGFSFAAHGRVTVQIQRNDGSITSRVGPALAIATPAYPGFAGLLVTPAGARALGLTFGAPQQYVARPSQPPSTDAVDRANGLLGVDNGVNVERGFQSRTGIITAILGGASGLVTVAGVAISVGLAAAEGRADLATLAAVGAAPRRRRWLAMAQAAVVGGVGVVVGVGLGTLIGGVMIGGFHLVPWAVPWLLLVVVILGVPLIAVSIAGLFTRSRLPMTHRLT